MWNYNRCSLFYQQIPPVGRPTVFWRGLSENKWLIKPPDRAKHTKHEDKAVRIFQLTQWWNVIGMSPLNYVSWVFLPFQGWVLPFFPLCLTWIHFSFAILFPHLIPFNFRTWLHWKTSLLGNCLVKDWPRIPWDWHLISSSEPKRSHST